MPVYNGEKYLNKAISSILNQTHKFFELIIIDDGSTDNTYKIIKLIKDKRVIYIKKNKSGIVDSLNLGIENCKSDIIFRMDSDDVSQLNRLEIQIKFMIDNPSVSLSGTFINIINEKNQIIANKKLPIEIKKIQESILYNSNIMHPTFCFRKKDICKIGKYRKEFIYAQDYDLLLRLLSNNLKIANIPQYLLNYRQTNLKKIDKIYFQMRLSVIAQKLYKDRMQYGYETKKNINLLKKKVKMNKLTILVYELFYYFNNKRKKNKISKFIWIILSYFIAIFSYTLLLTLKNDFIYYFKIKK